MLAGELVEAFRHEPQRLVGQLLWLCRAIVNCLTECWTRNNLSDRWVPTINAVTAYELGFLDLVRVKEREREKREREIERSVVCMCVEYVCCARLIFCFFCPVCITISVKLPT